MAWGCAAAASALSWASAGCVRVGLRGRRPARAMAVGAWCAAGTAASPGTTVPRVILRWRHALTACECLGLTRYVLESWTTSLLAAAAAAAAAAAGTAAVATQHRPAYRPIRTALPDTTALGNRRADAHRQRQECERASEPTPSQRRTNSVSVNAVSNEQPGHCRQYG